MVSMMDYTGLGWNMMGAWGGGMWGLGVGAAILILINVIAVLWATYDVMRPKKMDAGIRISWVVIILALQMVGVLLYLFMGRERNYRE